MWSHWDLGNIHRGACKYSDSIVAMKPGLQQSAGLAVCKRVSGRMSLLLSYTHKVEYPLSKNTNYITFKVNLAMDSVKLPDDAFGM